MIHVTQAAGSVLKAEALRVGELKLLWHPAGTDCSASHPGWYASSFLDTTSGAGGSRTVSKHEEF